MLLSVIDDAVKFVLQKQASETDADTVLFAYREAYYLERLEPGEGDPRHQEWKDQMAAKFNVAEIILAKQRRALEHHRADFEVELRQTGASEQVIRVRVLRTVRQRGAETARAAGGVA